MVKRPGQDEYDYKYLALDVKGCLSYAYSARQRLADKLPGHPRIYLENADANHDGSKKAGTTMFGVRWR